MIGWLKRRRTHKRWVEAHPDLTWRGLGKCHHCGVDKDTKCRFDCIALDPYDWRGWA